MSGSFVNPQPVDFLGPFLRNQLAGLQVQAARQKMQQQNALAALYRTPGNVDPATGSLTPQAMQQVMSIDPLTGMSIRKDEAQMQNQQAERQLHLSESLAKKQEMLQDVRGSSIEAYDQALQSGLSEPAARAAAQRIYSDGLDTLRQSGAFSAQEAQSFIPQFDPMRARANALKYKDWLAARDRQRMMDLRARELDDDDDDSGAGWGWGMPSGGSGGAGAGGGGGAAVPQDVWGRVIQQESGGDQFDDRGRPLTSSAGAIGVAQVMPATAKAAAARIGVPWDENRFRTDAAYNEMLGKAEFGRLMDKYQNPTLALAAYNAGEKNVAGWIEQYGMPGTKTISNEEWASRIPIKETRDYVRSIMARGGGPGAAGAPADSGAPAAMVGPADLASDDPKKQADALDQLANRYASVIRRKDPGEAKQKEIALDTELRSAAADLRSGDPARIQRGQQVVERARTQGEGFLKSGQQDFSPDDPHIQDVAHAIANYQIAPMTGFAMRSPYGQAVMAQVMKLNPDYQAEQFGARSKAARDFATGKQGDTTRFLNVAVAHLDTLGQLADALRNGDVRLFNEIGQRFAQETGSPAPTNFDAAKQIVGDEVVKAILGTGGAKADREEAAAQISRANSPEQLAGVIQTYQTLLGGQLKGLRKQYEDTTGLKNFDDRLLPETKAALERGERSRQQDTLPPAAAKLLQDGTVTTFNNGQRWTLRNGQPVRVP